jgi:hypothetical protein
MTQRMSSTSFGRDRESKALSAKVQADAQSNSGCSFCWFVLAIYPTLKGMTPRDTTTFQEHLKKAHGLRDEISP